jgi:hypothetical protein
MDKALTLWTTRRYVCHVLRRTFGNSPRPKSTMLQVASAQQYCTTVQGYPALHTWCEGHMKAMHSPPGQHEVLLTNGSNHTFEVHLFDTNVSGDAQAV